MSGGKVIRCKEDVVELDAAAPPMVATLSGVAKKRRKRKSQPASESCVPKWVAMRSKHGKTVKRCHCRGRFLKSETCKK
jgi:hypothetical protein